MNAVTKRPAAGHGLQKTKRPAVQHFSTFLFETQQSLFENVLSLFTIIKRVQVAKKFELSVCCQPCTQSTKRPNVTLKKISMTLPDTVFKLLNVRQSHIFLDFTIFV